MLGLNKKPVSNANGSVSSMCRWRRAREKMNMQRVNSPIRQNTNNNVQKQPNNTQTTNNNIQDQLNNMQDQLNEIQKNTCKVVISQNNNSLMGDMFGSTPQPSTAQATEQVAASSDDPFDDSGAQNNGTPQPSTVQTTEQVAASSDDPFNDNGAQKNGAQSTVRRFPDPFDVLFKNSAQKNAKHPGHASNFDPFGTSEQNNIIINNSSSSGNNIGNDFFSAVNAIAPKVNNSPSFGFSGGQRRQGTVGYSHKGVYPRTLMTAAEVLKKENHLFYGKEKRAFHKSDERHQESKNLGLFDPDEGMTNTQYEKSDSSEKIAKEISNITPEKIAKEISNITPEKIAKEMSNITPEKIAKEMSNIPPDKISTEMPNIKIEKEDENSWIPLNPKKNSFFFETFGINDTSDKIPRKKIARPELVSLEDLITKDPYYKNK